MIASIKDALIADLNKVDLSDDARKQILYGNNDYMNYYSEQTPEGIANAIKAVPATPLFEPRQVIEKLNADFKNDIDEIGWEFHDLYEYHRNMILILFYIFSITHPLKM